MNTASQNRIKIIALMELAIAAGILAFWTAFFSTDLVGISDPHLKEIYLAFESAFPAADFFLVFLLILGAVGLLRKMSYGFFFTLMAGACLIFLALLDISFNIRQGIYLLGLAESVLNISINAVCLATGTFFVFKIWSRQYRRPPLKNPRRSERDDIPAFNSGLGYSAKGAL
jgi:hypothetical protein